MTIPPPLDAIEQQVLTDLVRQAVGSETLQLTTWDARPLHYDATNPVSLGVYRLAGLARAGSQTLPWSLILKMVRSPAGVEVMPGIIIPPEADDPLPTHFANWKRELLAYQAGLLADLPGGVVAPRCFAVVEQAPRVFWLWLEDVSESEDAAWSLSRYAATARQLGQFNGAYLVGRPLPAAPWFQYGWLRSWITELEAHGGIARVPATAWQHPLVRQAFDPTVPQRLIDLWHDRETLLAAVDQLPRTLCHRDACRANLFTRYTPDGAAQTVAIDWAFSGIGAVGEELAPLITMAIERDALAAAELEATIVEGYVHGLREAGWTGDSRVVRLGYAAAAPLRYSFVMAVGAVMAALDGQRHPTVEQQRGQPIERIIAQQAACVAFLLDLADEARAMIGALS